MHATSLWSTPSGKRSNFDCPRSFEDLTIIPKRYLSCHTRHTKMYLHIVYRKHSPYLPAVDTSIILGFCILYIWYTQLPLHCAVEEYQEWCSASIGSWDGTGIWALVALSKDIFLGACADGSTQDFGEIYSETKILGIDLALIQPSYTYPNVRPLGLHPIWRKFAKNIGCVRNQWPRKSSSTSSISSTLPWSPVESKD